MSPDLPLSAWALIRHAYENTDRTVEEICAEHGISSGTLRDRMRRWHWTRRRQPIPAEGPPPMRLLPAPIAAPPVFYTPDGEAMRLSADTQRETPTHPLAAPGDPFDGDADAPSGDPTEIAQRLQGAVCRVLPAIEATVGLATNATQPRENAQAARRTTGPKAMRNKAIRSEKRDSRSARDHRVKAQRIPGRQPRYCIQG